LRTNSFIKLINTELNRELRKNNLDPDQLNRKDLQLYIDKMKNKIGEFVEEQVRANTMAVQKCRCKHPKHFTKCSSCKCLKFTAKNKSSVLLFLLDDMDEDEILYIA